MEKMAYKFTKKAHHYKRTLIYFLITVFSLIIISVLLMYYIYRDENYNGISGYPTVSLLNAEKINNNTWKIWINDVSPSSKIEISKFKVVMFNGTTKILSSTPIKKGVIANNDNITVSFDEITNQETLNRGDYFTLQFTHKPLKGTLFKFQIWWENDNEIIAEKVFIT
jgi:hypothetical protein